MIMMKQWKQRNLLYWLMFFSVLCVGGFFDWGTALLGSIVCTAAAVRAIRNPHTGWIYGKWIWLLLLQELCLVLGIFSAVDRGMALAGVIRFLSVIGWMFLCVQYTQKDRECALDAIPHAGCVMTAVSLAGYLLPALQSRLWVAQRMGGFFQYPNTCAIFLLIGLLYINGRRTRTAVFQWCILFWGILLTGSRTAMILMAGVLVINFIRQDRFMRRLIGFNILAAVAAGAGMVILTGSYQNLARLATVFSSNSTFWGRLLYWQDALRMIVGAPLGLGYRGYVYLQPVVQRGVYATLYVHNDFLQCFLDGGWIAGLALGSLMVYQLKHSRYRVILMVVFLHCMADFDLQFVSIWFAVLLLFDYGEEVKENTKIFRIASRICMIPAAVVCLYFLVPFAAEYLSHYEMAEDWYPYYTTAKEKILYYITDTDAALSQADEILAYNPYVSLAWEVKAQAAFEAGDIRGYAENKERVLAIERYDITQYEDYVRCLEQYKRYAEESGDMDTVRLCEEKCASVPGMLSDLEKQTSLLAWKLRDQPVFVLSAE